MNNILSPILLKIYKILTVVPTFAWYIAIGISAIILYPNTRELLLRQTAWIQTISTMGTVNITIILAIYVMFFGILVKKIGTLKGSILWFSGLATITITLLVVKELM